MFLTSLIAGTSSAELDLVDDESPAVTFSELTSTVLTM